MPYRQSRNLPMRVKELKLIVTFYTTASAIQMEKMCAAKGVPGRLIPVPREITSSCGMSWCAPVEKKNIIEKAAQ